MTITELIGILERAKEEYGDLQIRRDFHSSPSTPVRTIEFYTKRDNDIHSIGQPEKWFELYL